ncbi:MAG: NusG domain II-containing protein [Lachnospiraceae bacterium]
MIKKWDLILIVCFLMLAGGLWIIGAARKNGAYVIVNTKQDSQTYDLSRNQEIVIHNPDKNTENVIKIQDGEVSMESASCPDLICVHHKPIHKNGEVIVCVPNDVTIQVVSDVKNDIDN